MFDPEADSQAAHRAVVAEKLGVSSLSRKSLIAAVSGKCQSALAEDLDSSAISAEEKRNIKEAITDPTWRGGGSYVGFYHDITSHSKEIRPLRVSSIAYHSLGHIEVEGRASVFNGIGDVISSYEMHEQTIKDLCSALNAVLAREDLRSADKNKKFSGAAIERIVEENTTRLAEYLNLHNPHIILRVCDNNVLIYCKVILSYYRRIRDFYSFEREGRLTLNREPAANSPSTGGS